MFAAPGEPDILLVDVEGITFRAVRDAYCEAGEKFVEEAPREECVGTVAFPTRLAAHVLGRHKASLLELRKVTGCQIQHTKGEVDDVLTITAMNDQALKGAVEKVEAHIREAFDAQPFTHFVAVPLAKQRTFVGAVRAFIKAVEAFGSVSAQAFANLNRLHITLLTLRFATDEAAAAAAQMLARFASDFDWAAPVEAEFSGFNTFSDDDGARLFYAQPRWSDSLEMLRAFQDELACHLRGQGVEVVEVTDIFHATALRRAWFQGRWACEAMLVTGAEHRLPGACINNVVLCRRFVWKEDQFYFNWGETVLERKRRE